MVRCNVCNLEFDEESSAQCPGYHRHHLQPLINRKNSGHTVLPDTVERHITKIRAAQRRVRELLTAFEFERNTQMSQITDWAAQQAAKLAKIHEAVQALDDKIQAFQNSDGQLSVEDQAALDQISAESDALATFAGTIPAAPSSSAGASSTTAGDSSSTSAAGSSSTSSSTFASSSSTTATGSSSSSTGATPLVYSTLGVAVDTSGMTLYQFTGTGTPNPTDWLTSGVYVDENGNTETLYTYSGDKVPGDKTGDGLGGVWHVIADPSPVSGLSSMVSSSFSSSAIGGPTGSTDPQIGNGPKASSTATTDATAGSAQIGQIGSPTAAAAATIINGPTGSTTKA